MTVLIPKRRDNRVGNPKITQPTRGNIKRQPVASDPGARGGPTNIPSGAFTGASQGMVDAGNFFSEAGSALGSQLFQNQNRTDVLGTRVELNKLQNKLGALTGNYNPIDQTFRDPISGSIMPDGLTAYNTAFDDTYDRFYKELQKNPAYSQRMVNEFPQQAELVKADVKGAFSTVVNSALKAENKSNLQSDLAMDELEKGGLSISDRIKRNHSMANSLNDFSPEGVTPNSYAQTLSYADRIEIEAKANGNIFIKEIRPFVRSRQFKEAKDYLANLPTLLRNNGITAVSGASAEGIRLARKYLWDQMDTDAHRLRSEAKDNKPQYERVEVTRNDKVYVEWYDLKDVKRNPNDNTPIPVLGPIEKGDVVGEPNHILTNKSGKTFLISNDGDIIKELQTGPTQAETFKEEDAALKTLRPELGQKERLMIIFKKHYPQDETALDNQFKWVDIYAKEYGLPPEEVRLLKLNLIHDQSDLSEKMQRLSMLLDNGKITPEDFESRSLALLNTSEPADITMRKNLAWLKEREDTYTPNQYNAAVFRTRLGFELPEGVKNPTTAYLKLITNYTNERIGGTRSEALEGGYNVPEGLSSTSLEIQSRVLTAMQSGIYEDGTPVKNTGDIFAIVDKIASDEKYADKLPIRVDLKTQFDRAIHATFDGGKVTVLPSLQPFPENPDGMVNFIEKEGQQLLSKDRRQAMLPDIRAELVKQQLDVNRATGILSELQNFFGQLSQFGSDKWAREDVTKARLVFSLIARDYIRFVSLSPRFAVKEQELLRAIFPGPEILNSPMQASYRLEEFKDKLMTKINDLRITATDEDQDRSTRHTARREAQVWANTVRNIDRFSIKRPKMGTLKQISALNPAQTRDFLSNTNTKEFYDRIIAEKGEKQGLKYITALEQKMNPAK